MSILRELYPAIEPYVSGRLWVDEIHSLYWEECGNPDGVPVVFLHGGPGGGCSTSSRLFFDPARYRIVLFDQRGAGRSTPNGELRNNTTAHLIADLERLRKFRGIDAWHVFGGSWGSTLAVAYAQEFAEACLSLTLRGIFLMREWEIRWLFEAGRLFRPQAWETLLGGLPPELQEGDPLEGYAKLLEHPDHAVRLAAARRWSTFEATLANLIPNSTRIAEANETPVAYAMARIEVQSIRARRSVAQARKPYSPPSGNHRAGSIRSAMPPYNSHSVAPCLAGVAAHHRRRRRTLGDGARHSFCFGDGHG